MHALDNSHASVLTARWKRRKLLTQESEKLLSGPHVLSDLVARAHAAKWRRVDASPCWQRRQSVNLRAGGESEVALTSLLLCSP